MAAGIVIVGAGDCGARAAFALRENAYHGPITLIGDEPHLPYERPPLSKEALTAGEDAVTPKTVATAAGFATARIRCMTGTRVLAVDRAKKMLHLAGGASVAYERLLLAAGAQPRGLQNVPVDQPRCLYLRTVDDARRISRHLTPGASVAVVGGGFIGLEVAASARRRGASVTIVEARPRILTRGVPEDIARVVHERHLAEGVKFVLAAANLSVVAGPETVEVVAGDGRVVTAAVVVVGIGAIPGTEIAEAAGLAIDNGIAVDVALATGDPDIFAAGDCCSFPLDLYGGRRVRLESWRNAIDQGNLAAKNLLGADERHSAVPWFWSDQHDLTLQVAGLTDEGVETVRRDLGPSAFILFHLAGDGRLVAASGIGPGNAVARDMRIAEMLIARRASPAPDVLSAPGSKLKTLLAA